MRYQRALTAAAAALSTIALVGCSNDAPTADPQRFNEADVDFAGDMIQHHAQALEMVDLTHDRRLDPELAEMTEQIRAAQAPEIEQMVDWLEDWDRPVPDTSRDHANAHAQEHGEHPEMAADMPGMMSAQQMDTLANASGERFRTLWMQMMIAHHQGAVEMAETVVDQGQNADVRALAEDVIETQSAEIATMRDLLGG